MDRKPIYFSDKKTVLPPSVEALRMDAIMGNVSCGVTASIFRDDAIHILYANDRFFELFGHTRESYSAEITDNYCLIHPDDRDFVRRQMIAAGHSHEGATVEYRIIRPDGKLVWLRLDMSVTSFPDVEEPVELGIFYDVTDEHAAEEQLYFLNDLSHELLAQPDNDRAIEDALWKLLAYFSAHRAYVFEFDSQARTVSNSYEVCAQGISSEKSNLQNIPYETIDFWLHAFDEKRYISISDVDALDDSRAEERRVLQTQNIRSLIAVPMMRDGEYIGFIGIDDPIAQVERMDRLEAIGDFISVLLTRRDLSLQVREETQSINSIVDGIPGGFAKMQMMPDGTVQTLYLSEGFCTLVDMDDNLLRLYAHDAVDGVYPADLDIVHQMVEGLKKGEEANNIRYRLLRGGGGYVWTIVFGRTRVNDRGETFLHIYYTDATELVSAEEKQIELLDNLPCGAALYEYDGSNIHVIHLNRHFWELIGREPNHFVGDSVIDSIHPGDRQLVEQELAAALRQNRDFDASVRVLCAGGIYRAFHLAGKITPRKDGTYLIYASYTPISDAAMSTQELMPIALYTMLSASTDFAYIKGPDSRYICCNPATARLFGLRSEQDIIGKATEEIISPQFAEPINEDDNSVLETGQAIVDKDEAFSLSDGSVRYFIASRYPMRDAQGNVIGVYGVSRDVTVAKENESRLELMTNSIGAGLASYELGDLRGRCIYHNDGFYLASGYSCAEFDSIIAAEPLAFVLDEDRPGLMKIIRALRREELTTFTYSYRCHVKTGGFRWFSMTGTVVKISDSASVLNIVQYDITDQKRAEQQLRLSEQRLQLTVRQSGITICEYRLSDKSLTTAQLDEKLYSLPAVMQNVPYSCVEAGDISADTRDNYIAFYERILAGEDNVSARYKRKLNGHWCWLEARASLLYSEDNKPLSAVVSFLDIGEQVEKEAIYRKWEQSIQGRDKASYTLLRCNLNKDDTIDSEEGSLLEIGSVPKDSTFNSRALSFAQRSVYPEDRQRYLAFVSSDAMIAAYYRDNRTSSLEFRQPLPDGTVRWLRLTVELVQYPNSTDIAAYMLYENIDSEKRDELSILALAQNDPLTGILNRKTFIERANELLSTRAPGMEHALIMLDLDGFKHLNDTLGHDVGDRALIDVATALRSVLRKDDLVGRLGGDEFLVLLHDVPDDDIVASKAKQICQELRRSYSPEVKITASLGISLCPRHGDSFQTLYKKADSAMYHVKKLSRDSYAFYYDGIAR